MGRYIVSETGTTAAVRQLFGLSDTYKTRTYSKRPRCSVKQHPACQRVKGKTLGRGFHNGYVCVCDKCWVLYVRGKMGELKQG